MKRFLKVCICLLMVVGVVGCGGSDSTEKQEAVVKHFLSILRKQTWISLRLSVLRIIKI